MKPITRWLKGAAGSVRAAMSRFPVAVGCAAVVAVICLILTRDEGALSSALRAWLERAAWTLALGIPLSVATQLYLERKGGRPAWQAALIWVLLAVLLALYGYFLVPADMVLSLTAAVRYLALMLAAVALVVAVAFLPRGEGDERFAMRLLWRLFMTGVFTGVLIGGVSLVLLMLDMLLNVDIQYKAYLYVFIACAGFFAPSFFLVGLPAAPGRVQDEPYSPLLRVLIGYILYPLLSIYTGIIYIYLVRMLALGIWPSNRLVNLVLWYTAIGVLSQYFLRSQSGAHRWLRLFDRWYPRLTVVPLVLMFIGLFMRIGQYGFTEPRYLVLVLGLWVAALSVYALLRAPARRLNLVAPALLCALAALAVLGPWNAFAVSRASQNARLHMLLARNHMLTADQTLQPGKDVPEVDRREIYAVLDYFEYNHSLSDVRALDATQRTIDRAALLGFERPSHLPDRSPYRYFALGREPVGALDVREYDYLYTNQYGSYQPQGVDGLTFELQEDRIFFIRMGDELLYSKELDIYISQMDEENTLQEMTFTDQNDAVRVKFVFQAASADYTNPDAPVYRAEVFTALVALK